MGSRDSARFHCLTRGEPRRRNDFESVAFLNHTQKFGFRLQESTSHIDFEVNSGDNIKKNMTDKQRKLTISLSFSQSNAELSDVSLGRIPLTTEG